MNPTNIDLKLHQLSDNLCLYYAHLVDEIYQRLMAKSLSQGHEGLKLSHALILPQISMTGTRIIDIAKSQNVSKQAIGQIANELEKLGYITRSTDAEDKRAKKLILTAQGIELIKQAAEFMNSVEQELREEMGEPLLNAIKTYSILLFKSFSLEYPRAGQFTPKLPRDLPLIVYAASIADHLDLLLQEQNSAKGHPPLKRSYWHILERITKNGIRINELAELNGISKQAISQLANDIEKAGYISRLEDPDDKRAKNLFLSDKGENLVVSSLASTQFVESIVESKIGKIATLELKKSLQLFQSKDKDQMNNSDINISKNLQQLMLSFSESMNSRDKKLWFGRINEENRQITVLSEYAIQELKSMKF